MDGFIAQLCVSVRAGLFLGNTVCVRAHVCVCVQEHGSYIVLTYF